MSEDSLTLVELMFHAERFCLKVESAIFDRVPSSKDDEELGLKIGQCRNLLQRLQESFENDSLTIENSTVRADFRTLIISLLWVAFWGRRAIDHKLFRMVVLIEAGFTYLLINQN